MEHFTEKEEWMQMKRRAYTVAELAEVWDRGRLVVVFDRCYRQYALSVRRDVVAPG